MTTPVTPFPPNPRVRPLQRLEGPLFVPVRSEGNPSSLMLASASGGLSLPLSVADFAREVLSVLERSH